MYTYPRRLPQAHPPDTASAKWGPRVVTPDYDVAGIAPRPLHGNVRCTGAVHAGPGPVAFRKGVFMKIRYALCLALCASLAGCVIGDGRCLFLEPMKASLTGTIHFRDYPAGGGVD